MTTGSFMAPRRSWIGTWSKAALLSLLLAAPAGAGEVVDDDATDPDAGNNGLKFSATAALASEYVFRGVSQTAEGPSAQVTFTAEYRYFYASVFASNVDYGADIGDDGNPFSGANTEFDFTIGIRKKLRGTTVEFAVEYDHFPNAVDTDGELDNTSFLAGISTEITPALTASANLQYYGDFSGELGETYAIEGKLGHTFSHGFAVSGTLGFITNQEEAELLADGSTEYWYWNVGLSKTFADKFTIDLRYWDTNGGEDCSAVATFQCDGRVVAKLSADF